MRDGPETTFWPMIMQPAVSWFAGVVPHVPNSRASNTLLFAIAGQEAGWRSRVQAFGGPAHGLWQFERGGGVRGVLSHPATRDAAQALCDACGVTPHENDVWQALTSLAFDHLAFGFARLLLWSDARPLPAPVDTRERYGYYLRNWRPGTPRPLDWPRVDAISLTQVPADE